jgi:ankyrin repeat protein
MSHFLNKQLVHETHRGRLDRVAALLAKGAAINKLASDGFTPVMRAAYHGHRDLVAMLLEHGADPNVTAKDGASALFWACLYGHEGTAEWLLAAGADVTAIRQPDVNRDPKDGPAILMEMSPPEQSKHRNWNGSPIRQKKV